MAIGLRSMRRVAPTPPARKRFQPSSLDQVDREPCGVATAIAGQGFPSVHDATVEPGPTWTNLDRILDQDPADDQWDALSALRWGPAVGDPIPGIVINIPSRERMLAALRSRADGGLA
jgi:hypothetical protein